MKKYIALLLSVLMMTAALFSGCSQSEPQTLEEMVSANEEVAEEVNKSVEGTGIQISIKDNAVTYTYDISTVDGVTEEMLEDEQFIEAFRTSIDSQGPSYAGTCADLEEKTGLEGVSITVIYVYGDKEVASSTYTSADAAEDSGSSDEEKAEGDQDA